MEQINIYEAKTHFSSLIEKVAAGNEIIIAKAGKPMARVIPYIASAPTRVGFMTGEIKVPADFDRMGDTEIGEMFG